MLDVIIRILAHVLTPLFFLGMAGAALLVFTKLASDVVDFFADETSDSIDPPR